MQLRILDKLEGVGVSINDLQMGASRQTVPAPLDELRALLAEARNVLERMDAALERATAAQNARMPIHLGRMVATRLAAQLSPESRRQLRVLLPAILNAFGHQEFKVATAWASFARHTDPAVRAAVQSMTKHQFGLLLGWAASATARAGQAAEDLPFSVTRRGAHNHTHLWRVRRIDMETV